MSRETLEEDAMSSGKRFKLLFILLTLTFASQLEARPADYPGTLNNGSEITILSTSPVKMTFAEVTPFNHEEGKGKFFNSFKEVKLRDGESLSLYNNTSSTAPFQAGISLGKIIINGFPTHAYPVLECKEKGLVAQGCTKVLALKKLGGEMEGVKEQGIHLGTDIINTHVLNTYQATAITGQDFTVFMRDSSDSEEKVLSDGSQRLLNLPPGGSVKIIYKSYGPMFEDRPGTLASEDMPIRLPYDAHFQVKLACQKTLGGSLAFGCDDAVQKMTLNNHDGTSEVISLTGEGKQVWLCTERQDAPFFTRVINGSTFPDNMFFEPSTGDFLKVLVGEVGASEPEKRYVDVESVIFNADRAKFLLSDSEGDVRELDLSEQSYVQQPCIKIRVMGPVSGQLSTEEKEEEEPVDTDPEGGDPAEPEPSGVGTANGSNTFGNIVGSRNPADDYQLGGGSCSVQRAGYSYSRDGAGGLLLLLAMVAGLLIKPLRQKK